MMASMCVRILFLSFEEFVIRQSHNIKETLREKENIDLYLVKKSKITEQLCHIYHRGIISLKEFLIVYIQKFRQQMRKLERKEENSTDGKFCRYFLNWSGHLQTPCLTLVQQATRTTQDPFCAIQGNRMSVVCCPTSTRAAGKGRDGPFSQR